MRQVNVQLMGVAAGTSSSSSSSSLPPTPSAAACCRCAGCCSGNLRRSNAARDTARLERQAWHSISQARQLPHILPTRLLTQDRQKDRVCLGRGSRVPGRGPMPAHTQPGPSRLPHTKQAAPGQLHRGPPQVEPVCLHHPGSGLLEPPGARQPPLAQQAAQRDGGAGRHLLGRAMDSWLAG